MQSLIGKWYFWMPFIIIVVVLFWFFPSIIAYIFLALIISLLGHPIVKFLNGIKIFKKHLPQSISAAVALILVLGTMATIIIIAVPMLIKQVEFITNVDIYAILDSFKEPINNAEDWLREYGIISETETIESIISAYLLNIFHEIDVKNVINSTFGMVGSIFIGGFSIIFIAYFFMKDDKILYKGIKLLTPKESHDEIARIMSRSKKFLSRYFIGLILEQLIMMTIITIGMNIIGVKNALLIGVIAGIFNVIPYLGPIIGDVIGAIIGLATLQGADFSTESLPLIIMMVIVFVICNLIDNFVLQPVIYSKSVKAHPLEIFFIVIMAGIISGPIGMILAIPAYTFIRIVAMELFQNIPAIQQMTQSLRKETKKEVKRNENKPESSEGITTNNSVS